MVHLTSIEIQNFQSHKHTVLPLSPGTNVIVGASDSGKSAILRALTWVITNRPLGDAFRSEWGGETKVSLVTSDGHTVDRVRSASRNDYVVDGVVLSAFGTEVPEEVTNVLRLDELSVQGQMDSPFLLAMSPGEAARLLNRAASLDEIDRAVAGLHKAQLGLNRDLKYGQSQITQYKEQLADYADLPALEDRLRLVEAAEISYHARLAAYTEKRALLDRACALTVELDMLPPTDRAEACLVALQAAVPRWEQGQKRLAGLQASVQRAGRLERELAQSVPTARAEETIDSLSEALRKWQEGEGRVKVCRDSVATAKRLFAGIRETEVEERKLQVEYRRIAPDECPLCGNPMPKEVG